MSGKRTSWNADINSELKPLTCEVEPRHGGFVAVLTLIDTLTETVVTSESHVVLSHDEAQAFSDGTAIKFGLNEGS